jgi:hypothetical protein
MRRTASRFKPLRNRSSTYLQKLVVISPPLLSFLRKPESRFYKNFWTRFSPG